MNIIDIQFKKNLIITVSNNIWQRATFSKLKINLFLYKYVSRYYP